MEPLDELRPGEYECAYDPHLPISAACRSLLASVEAMRSQFVERTADLEKRAVAAAAAFDLIRADADPIGVDSRPDRIQYMAPPVKQPRFARALQTKRTAEAARRSYAGDMVVNIVAAFDTFEAELMRAAFKIRPELLISSGRALFWRDLVDLADNSAVHGLVVEREVESMLHESHVEQLNTIAKRFNASAVAELEEKEDLIEVTERRNLYAHQGGRITAYYLAKAKKAPGDHNPGQSLITEPAYFDEACNVIILAAIKMTQMVWRAVGGPAKLGAADRDLSQIAYEYLLYQQWELAGRILRFAGTVEHSTEQHMLVFAINHAQAFKWQGNTKACESVLSKIDWNAKDQALQLSRAVLLEDYEEAARLMYDVGSTRQVQKSAFDYWPIYRDFRKSDIYRHVYMELYKQPPPEVDDDETLDL